MANIEKSSITVGQAVNGTEQQVTVFTVKGQRPGPKVYIQANLHGAELQGNAVIYHLLRRLQHQNICGEIVIVPQANPVGINQKSGEYTSGRFDPVTGENWNRQYHHDLSFIDEFVSEYLEADEQTIKTAFAARLQHNLTQAINNPWGLKTGQRICYALQQLAFAADYVLDLHTGPESSKHIYVPEYAAQAAGYFNIPHVLLIPNQFDGALDEACFVPWWQLTEAFAAKGRELPVFKQAFTLELGSQELIDLGAAEYDADSIFSYLSHKGVFVDKRFAPRKMTRYGCLLNNYKTVYAPKGGMVEYKASLGEVLPPGRALATFLNIQQFGEPDVLSDISLDRPVLPILHCASAAVAQGGELYKVFNEFFTLAE